MQGFWGFGVLEAGSPPLFSPVWVARQTQEITSTASARYQAHLKLLTQVYFLSNEFKTQIEVGQAGVAQLTCDNPIYNAIYANQIFTSQGLFCNILTPFSPKMDSESMHYRLRLIESVHQRFLNFASHFICLQIFQIGFSTERLILSASKYSRYIFRGRNAQFSIGTRQKKGRVECS